ncbi:DCC family protein At1g52590, chloroplastic isoform X1 [Selaginella moellendorffii]|uniref:DCC family protein At1g52590, chloroplastic isoform X1 n=1 Tax=Selaginella moellendorffii TaxID=88036 RepID=UPI000D1CA61C|nr:DCC family protein At1g52590, chloroplastic isoform X1 [Selaginella moellendorffii]|eukprot:XP_024516609.1 DCC family protein At1g52590, chloroplastic isoform X1 [Selaginella moellendorffii]
MTLCPRTFCASSPWQPLFASDTRPVILFDGVCNLCNGGVNFVLDRDPRARLRFAALQSNAGRALLERSGRSRDDISSIVLVEKQRSYIKSEAVLRIAHYLDEPYPSLATLALLFPLLSHSPFPNSLENRHKSILNFQLSPRPNLRFDRQQSILTLWTDKSLPNFG